MRVRGWIKRRGGYVLVGLWLLIMIAGAGPRWLMPGIKLFRSPVRHSEAVAQATHETTPTRAQESTPSRSEGSPSGAR